jgi:hypothetical protein
MGAPLVDSSVLAKLPEPARRHIDLLRSMADSFPAVCNSLRGKEYWQGKSPGMGTALEHDPDVLDLVVWCANREERDTVLRSTVFARFDPLRESRGDETPPYSCANWALVSPESPPRNDEDLRTQRERILTSGCGPEAMKITEFRWLADGSVGVALSATIKVREANRLVDDAVIATLPEVVKRNIGLIRSLADSLAPRCDDVLKARKKLPSPAAGTALARDPAVLQVEAVCTFVWKKHIPVSKKHPWGNVESKFFALLRREDGVPSCPFWKLAAPDSATPGPVIKETIAIPDEPRCKQNLVEVDETRPLKEGDVRLEVLLRRDSPSQPVIDN